MEKGKKLLGNVVLIRLLLIVLLVFYHAFAIYSGAWEPIVGYPEIKTYYWLALISNVCMMETFVFVSGYVFGYQVRKTGGGKLQAKDLFFNKFKRLMIPCMFFSLLYVVMFQDIKQPIVKTLYDMVNGVGHMWFLPMLFWCFIGIWMIEKVNTKASVTIPLLFVSASFSFVVLPLQLSNAMYFMLFFYIGFLIERKSINTDRFINKRWIIIITCFLVVLFPLLTLFKEQICLSLDSGDGSLAIRFLSYSVLRISRIIWSSVGVFLLFVIAGVIDKISNIKYDWLIEIGKLSMGVYLLQQFILKFLYYYSELPIIVSPVLLPWVGFFVTLFTSVFFSWIARKTRTGRFIIG